MAKTLCADVPFTPITMNDEEAINCGADHAGKVWNAHGADAVFSAAIYRKAVADLGKRTANPLAKPAFDNALLDHARAAREILRPKLPRHPPPPPTD